MDIARELGLFQKTVVKVIPDAWLHTYYCRCAFVLSDDCPPRMQFDERLLTYLLTYLLTPWSRVLLDKLTGSAASQEIPRIFGTRRFLTLPTSARHLSLS